MRLVGSLPAPVLCPAELLPTELFRPDSPPAGLDGLLGGFELASERRMEVFRDTPPVDADDLNFCA